MEVNRYKKREALCVFSLGLGALWQLEVEAKFLQAWSAMVHDIPF
jgi:hypothetical protein